LAVQSLRGYRGSGRETNGGDHRPKVETLMTYATLAYAHLATVAPAFVIGTALMLRRKGTTNHRFWGRLYIGLMMVTAVISLFMPALVGPKFLGHFGFIHSFSTLTLTSVPYAFWAIRNGNRRAHQQSMIGVYAGGLLIAGGFAFAPGRILHGWLSAALA
jgi:uncharacterized membrane protein